MCIKGYTFFKLWYTVNMVSYACETVTLNATSCVRQHRHLNREWNEHSTMSDSLFGSTSQDVAICGHNASSITVHASSCLSRRTVAPIPGGCNGFVPLIPHSSCSGTTLLLLLSGARLGLQAPRVPGWDPDWVGMRGMQIGVRGGRERHKVNEEIESRAWLAFGPPRSQQHLKRAEGLLLLRHRHPLAMCGQINQDDPTNSSTVSSAHCTDVDSYGTYCISTFCEYLFWSTHSCGNWHPRATHLQLETNCSL